MSDALRFLRLWWFLLGRVSPGGVGRLWIRQSFDVARVLVYGVRP